MLEILAVALLTAALSSALTLAAVWWLLEKRVRPELERDVERRLRDALEQLGDTVETRVKRGVLDAVASLPTSEMIADTTRTAARTGAELVTAGLGGLLRAGARRRDP